MMPFVPLLRQGEFEISAGGVTRIKSPLVPPSAMLRTGSLLKGEEFSSL